MSIKKYTADDGKVLFEHLSTVCSLDYGAAIPVAIVHEYLGIVVPERGTREEFKQIELVELSFMNHVRRLLLKDGKYLQLNGSAYRILLLSENANKVNSLMESASRKLRMAETLRRTTPTIAGSPPCNNAIRIAAKQAAIREAQDQANLMS